MTNNVKNLLPIINKKIPQKLLDTSLRWNIGFWLKDFKHDAIQQFLYSIYFKSKSVFNFCYLHSVLQCIQIDKLGLSFGGVFPNKASSNECYKWRQTEATDILSGVCTMLVDIF